MSRRATILFALLLAAGACKGERPAEPANEDSARPAPSARDDASPAIDRAAYRRALDEGRQLAAAGRWSEAVVAFERALAASPGDPRASSELGWAAFHVGDLDLAVRMNEAALAAAKTPQLAAASHYNLGRVAEKRGDVAGAASHYRESLERREHATVRERLARIDARQCEGLELKAWRPLEETDSTRLCGEARAEDSDIDECEIDELSDRVVIRRTVVKRERFEELFVVRGAGRVAPVSFGTHSAGGRREELQSLEEHVIGERLVLVPAVFVMENGTEAIRMSACAVDGKRVRCLVNDRHGDARLEVSPAGEARFVSVGGSAADECLGRTFGLW